MRLAKNLHFGERMNLALQAQAFNLTNRANYGNNFGTSITSGTFNHPVGFIAPGATTIPRVDSGKASSRTPSRSRSRFRNSRELSRASKGGVS